jgi:hypothetical protein
MSVGWSNVTQSSAIIQRLMTYLDMYELLWIPQEADVKIGLDMKEIY